MQKKIVVGILLITNLLLWLIPSNVVELLARQRPILLGRYSIDRFSVAIMIFIFSLLIFYLLNSPNKKKLKLRIFQIIAVFMVLLPSLLVVDITARQYRTPRYQGTGNIVHRPPGIKYNITYLDKPRMHASAISGFANIPCAVHIDKRGFRNLREMDTAQIVVLGDSFAEGSNVSDKQTWRELFISKTNISLYNLGVSGTDPQDYLAAFRGFGLGLDPKTVFCMLYEGNDFRGSGELKDQLKTPEPFFKRIRRYIKQSPVTMAIRMFFVDNLSLPINPHKINSKAISWLPIEVPEKTSVYYDFPPKRLLELYQTKEEFSQSPGWKTAQLALLAIHKICQEKNIRLVLVYAPTKVHVILPLLANRISAEQIKANMLLRVRKLPRSKRNLPAAKELLKTLLACLDSKEEVTRQFCQKQGIEFISVTKSLRKTAARGQQIYFTYDQHWTPIGHQVVADEISKHWVKE